MKENSYSRIIKSSSMVGGSQAINMFIGLIRIKVVAILIGPIGVGLIATYQSLSHLIVTITGLGLQSSAVRDIAEVSSKNDLDSISKIAISLRRMSLLTGVLGCITVASCSNLISEITFGSYSYTNEIFLLSFYILFSNIKGGQIALIQGMRRIGDMARLNIISAFVGTVFSVSLYWIFGVKGIVPAIVSMGAVELLTAYYFAQKIQVNRVNISWSESFRISGGMFKLGLAFMWNGLLIALIAYLTRLLIAQELDLVAVGVFSAAFALSGLIVNFVLSAMGADYYPALVSIKDNNDEMCRLVNQQTLVGILLVTPGLAFAISLAPVLVNMFYSPQFSQASDLLIWFSLGCFGRVLSWPLGFVVLAKGYSRVFTVIETGINIIHFTLIYGLLSRFGIEGVSVAFFIMYLIYTMIMLVVIFKLIKFKWSKDVQKYLSIIFSILTLLLVVKWSSTFYISLLINIFISSFTTVMCLSVVISKLGKDNKIYNKIKGIPFFNVFFKVNNKN